MDTAENNYRRRWQQNRPWTECLALLFGGVQQELAAQYLALDEKGDLRALVPLNALERIALAHIQDMRTRRVARRFGEANWRQLMQELDRERVPLDDNLSSFVNRVLAEARRTRNVATWEEAYDCCFAVTLGEKDKPYRLRRVITQAIYNAAERAAMQTTC